MSLTTSFLCGVEGGFLSSFPNKGFPFCEMFVSQTKRISFEDERPVVHRIIIFWRMFMILSGDRIFILFPHLLYSATRYEAAVVLLRRAGGPQLLRALLQRHGGFWNREDHRPQDPGLLCDALQCTGESSRCYVGPSDAPYIYFSFLIYF